MLISGINNGKQTAIQVSADGKVIIEGASGGNRDSGVTAEEIKAVIEAASNLDRIESNQASTNQKLTDILSFIESSSVSYPIGPANSAQGSSVIGGIKEIGEYRTALIYAENISRSFYLDVLQGTSENNLRISRVHLFSDDVTSLENAILDGIPFSGYYYFVSLHSKVLDIRSPNKNDADAEPFKGSLILSKDSKIQDIFLGNINASLIEISARTDLGTQIQEAVIPGGGSGVKGLLSWIALILSAMRDTIYLIRDRLAGTATEETLGALNAKTPALGQALAAGSTPVVLPTAQINALTPLSTITANLGTISNAATEATLNALNTKTPGLGQALAAGSTPVVLPIAQINALTPLSTITANLGTIAGAATDISLQNILANLPSATKPTLVRSLAKKFRDDFNGTALDPTSWSLVQTGAGQTVSVSSSELRILTGTGANSETIIKGLVPFTIPFRVQFQFSLSTRILNQEIFLEVTDASGNNKASIILDMTGSSVSAARLVTANEGVSNASINTVSFIATNAVNILDLEVYDDEVNLYSKYSDQSLGRVNVVLTSTRKLPNPNSDYFVQIRSKNGTAAPSASLTFTVDSVYVSDHEELNAEITSARGGGVNSAMSVVFPTPQVVTIGNTPSISSISSITNTVATVVNATKDYLSSSLIYSTPIVANGIYTTTGISNGGFNKLRGWVFTDQPGTLFIEHSRDNATFRQASPGIPCAGGVVTPYDQVLYAGFYRYRYVNGGTAQTFFELVGTQFGIGA
jgi:hypothetical protein